MTLHIQQGRFLPRLGGSCEANLYRYSVVGHVGYCGKRARWYDQATGYILCGEHKRVVEGDTTSHCVSIGEQ